MNRRDDLTRRQFLAAGAAALAAARTAEGAGCTATEDNPPGPFYLPGAPFRDQLAPPDEPGERLRITGRVLAGPNCTPLEGAIVDVWHASTEGFYYGLERSGPPRPEDFTLRGRIRTDAAGRYQFDTVRPGQYRVNRTWTRPRHIHYTVSHPSGQSLTTQLYFEGDPYQDTDPLVKRSLIIPLKRREEGKTVHYEGVFDVVLASG